ncbi:MAG TPA: hypothetical protein VMV33_10020 [Rhodocyclaceae bacterium]|nr:hypothetical protein [Rhodocyclaceae bacterium]
MTSHAMSTASPEQRRQIGAIRIAFGLVCLANTYLQANSAYIDHFGQMFRADWVSGQPAWLMLYGHHMALWVERIGASHVALATVIINGGLALSLLTGLGLRYLTWVGVAFNLWLWSTVGGLGGPYIQGATDPGTAIVYALIFVFVGVTRAWEGMSWSHGGISGPSVNGVRIGRLLFGALWAFDAYWKWQPFFLTHAVTFLQQAQDGQPAWIVAYIGWFVLIINRIGPLVFGIVAALAETAIALSLLTGWGLRWMLWAGALYSVGLWTTAEGWGGPYGIGFTGNKGDVLGTINIYLFAFLFLLTLLARKRRGETANSIGTNPNSF